jgi:membrane-associated phospholipid phosphatase
MGGKIGWMDHVTTGESRPFRLRLAHEVSEMFSPGMVVLLLALVVSWKATGHVWRALLWAVVIMVFSVGLPMAFVVRGARQGRWDTHHVRDREHRFLPLMVGLGSTLVGLAILVAGGAPRALVAFSLAMAATLAVCVAVTTRWKVSLHAVVAAGAVAITTQQYGPVGMLLSALLVLVCWSRVVLGEHTVAQVVAGAVLGPVVGGVVLLFVG